MRIIAFGLAIGSMIFARPGVTQSTAGLHNDTKVFTAPLRMKKSDWTEEAELRRTWSAAFVRIPATDGRHSVSGSMRELLNHDAVQRFPTIIYMHGCSGIWSGTIERIDWLAEHGFAVIAPASFARKKYPQSCNVERRRGGYYRGTLGMRQHDAGFAIRSAKQLPWVNPDRVYLMGFSQGGIVTATFAAASPEESVKAKIIEGWTCHAGWPEYGGLIAPRALPVLSLLSDNDPWFQADYLRGECGQFMRDDNGSRSEVFATDELRNRHSLLHASGPREIVLKFLRKDL